MVEDVEIEIPDFFYTLQNRYATQKSRGSGQGEFFVLWEWVAECSEECGCGECERRTLELGIKVGGGKWVFCLCWRGRRRII
jgi:hypothetical protein